MELLPIVCLLSGLNTPSQNSCFFMFFFLFCLLSWFHLGLPIQAQAIDELGQGLWIGPWGARLVTGIVDPVLGDEERGFGGLFKAVGVKEEGTPIW